MSRAERENNWSLLAGRVLVTVWRTGHGEMKRCDGIVKEFEHQLNILSSVWDSKQGLTECAT